MVGILSETDTPVQLSLKHFDIIAHEIPNDWIFIQDSNGIFIGPKEFTDEFWMYFHDGDTLDPVRGYEAQALFKEVVNKIYAFHELPPRFVEEEKEPEPLKEHEWWKEYLDEDER